MNCTIKLLVILCSFILSFCLTVSSEAQFSMPKGGVSAEELGVGRFRSEACEIRLTAVESGICPTDVKMGQLRFLAMVRSSEKRLGVKPVLNSKEVNRWSVTPPVQDLQPNRWSLFYISTDNEQGLTQSPSVRFRLSFQPESENLSFRLALGCDLTFARWESLYRGAEEKFPQGDALLMDFFKSTDVWKSRKLPSLWSDLGVTWLRLRFRLSESLKSVPATLFISAVDDNDQTYLNGRLIGKLSGWDTPRRYPIPADLVRWNTENELLIAVGNNNAGGGIANAPIRLEFGETGKSAGESATGSDLDSEFPEFLPNELFPSEPLEHEANRQAPRPVGKPEPLRPMSVRNGVLEYNDGGEVALWGTNYYPQSWYQYRSLKKRGIDPKEAVCKDFDDFAGADPGRFDIIRIHVFDTEISDENGNLVINDHLDILDALVDECNRRGVYLWLTPIAWWGSPEALPNAFSKQMDIRTMTLDESARLIQKNWLRQFLSHRNPYTNRRLVDEPCLALFELINEPHYYWRVFDLQDAIEGKGYQPSEQKQAQARKMFADWTAGLPDPSWASDQTWKFYCYDRIRSYIDELHAEIRSLGAKQPIAYHASSWSTPPAVYQAIADSPAEAITLNYYSGLTQTPVGDKKPWLKGTVHVGVPQVLNEKARLVYEFDASDTLHQIDLYPALGRYWRELGVQAACQFQYDSRFTADANQDWATHYLNFRHTPERIASFLIGGELFRTLPRGTSELSVEQPDELIFPFGATSWTRNASLFCSPDRYLQARPTDWRPLPIPENPAVIQGVGSTPYYEYRGTGLVQWRRGKDDLQVFLTIFPSVERLINGTLTGTPEKPLTKLSDAASEFRVTIEAWKSATVEKKNAATGNWELYPGTGKAFTPTPGEYRLRR